jgi:hypothetical protein
MKALEGLAWACYVLSAAVWVAGSLKFMPGVPFVSLSVALASIGCLAMLRGRPGSVGNLQLFALALAWGLTLFTAVLGAPKGTVVLFSLIDVYLTLLLMAPTYARASGTFLLWLPTALSIAITAWCFVLPYEAATFLESDMLRPWWVLSMILVAGSLAYGFFGPKYPISGSS